ncbi:hypothetical protein PsYK624_112330 [Phanerochaete sordida]|uniref:Fungal-type protein kinase domain-containing protein n=1 Tax=Phanerochaete sordida TaxID=48140 RepID=A0A9P3GIU3_9APHY|nr:hypothetical protein PsYK624_112330 [Phanerochaete sordida]
MTSPVTDDDRRITSLPTHAVDAPRRIIHSAVALPLLQECSLRDAFACIGEALQALLSLHDLGLVHQNISYANTAVINGTGKILDLDRAKQPEESARHGHYSICTITPFFVSHEVEDHSYWHRPYTSCDDSEELDDPRKINFRSDNSTRRKPILSHRPDKIPFRHNPLHDFESLFLLCIFLLLATEFEKRPEDTTDAISKFERAHSRLFAVVLSDTSLRRRLFTGGAELSTLFKALHPSMRQIALRLDVVREAFRSAYADAEAAMTTSTPIPHTAGRELAAIFANQLLACIAVLRKSTLHFLEETQLRSQSPAWSAVPVSRYVVQEAGSSPLAARGAISTEAKARHYIVLDKFGEPISQIKSLHDMFFHLGRIFLGLMLLHALGWTHKNISHDKIFILDDKANLIDLDFAKCINESSELYATYAKARYFASTEACYHEYQHRPRRPLPTNPTIMDPLTDFVEPPSCTRDASSNRKRRQVESSSYPTFSYNPLHDLEAMFWLCTFLVLASTYDHSASCSLAQLADYRSGQARLYGRILGDDDTRSLMMLSHCVFRGRIVGLHPTVAQVMHSLDLMRAELVDAFEAAEKAMDAENPIPCSVGVGAGNAMGGVVLQICASLQQNGDLTRIVEDLVHR